MVKDRNHQSAMGRGYKNVSRNVNRSSDRINCNNHNHNYYVRITIDNTSEPVAEDTFSAIRELQERNIDLVVKRLDKLEGTLNETLLAKNLELENQREHNTAITKRYEELEAIHTGALENIEKLNRDLSTQRENSVLMEKKIEELQMALSEAQENITMLNLRNASNDHGIEDTTAVVPRKKSVKKRAKHERNVDTDDSTSSQVSSRSNASSDSEVPVANSHENSAVITSQKKAVKKCKRAKNRRKQGTSNSTTSNSNTHAEEVPGESNMDIIPASLPRSNQFPRFQSGSEGSAPDSIPQWFWYLCSLILLSNSNRSNVPYLQINYTDNSINYVDNSRKRSGNSSSTRVIGNGNKCLSISGKMLNDSTNRLTMADIDLLD